MTIPLNHARDITPTGSDYAVVSGVIELLRLQDVATGFEQVAGHGVDDARAIGAGQGEDVAGGHGYAVLLCTLQLKRNLRDRLHARKSGVRSTAGLPLKQGRQ